MTTKTDALDRQRDLFETLSARFAQIDAWRQSHRVYEAQARTALKAVREHEKRINEERLAGTEGERGR